ncbi:DNA cytosine methyltransferase [Methylopila sp. M107]|uniref:DNA cytosine methyltransferase n=1 Tax=Methylopila sp. M107 TaxID=1101190 RepID=UPI00036ECF24|nr:DNA cytosine methyltransferase [Methylopila sp. M107]
MTSRKPIGIELFAGCGGLSTGFLDAGLHVAAGFELDLRAVDAYNYNHAYRGSIGVAANLSNVTGEYLLHSAGLTSVDFLIGGPPCQPFSIVGKRRGAEDIRADLMAQYVRIVRELAPKAILLENVPNLVTIEGGVVLKKAAADLRALGYSVKFEVLSAADFGVPQGRKRLILLGFKGRKSVSFPEPTHGPGRLPFATASDAIGDLPDAGEFGANGVHNHEPTAHSADMVRRFSTLQPGKREKGSFHDRLHAQKPSYTLRAGSGNFSPLRPVHYSYDRVITVRESARIQGFSDDFIWPDRIPRLQQYRQVGNAVPPPLAAAVARSMAEQMGWTIDPEGLHGDPASRPAAMTMTDSERVALRTVRMRGASLGRAALIDAAE